MYRCSKCGQPKRGHICPYKAKTMAEVIDLCLSDDDAGASVVAVGFAFRTLARAALAVCRFAALAACGK